LTGTTSSFRLLLIEPDEAVAAALSRGLRRHGWTVNFVRTAMAALLGEWGCDRGQGYLFSKPLDGQAAGALLEAATQQVSNAGPPSEAARLVT